MNRGGTEEMILYNIGVFMVIVCLLGFLSMTICAWCKRKKKRKDKKLGSTVSAPTSRRTKSKNENDQKSETQQMTKMGEEEEQGQSASPMANVELTQDDIDALKKLEVTVVKGKKQKFRRPPRLKEPSPEPKHADAESAQMHADWTTVQKSISMSGGVPTLVVKKKSMRESSGRSNSGSIGSAATSPYRPLSPAGRSTSRTSKEHPDLDAETRYKIHIARHATADEAMKSLKSGERSDAIWDESRLKRFLSYYNECKATAAKVMTKRQEPVEPVATGIGTDAHSHAEVSMQAANTVTLVSPAPDDTGGDAQTAKLMRQKKKKADPNLSDEPLTGKANLKQTKTNSKKGPMKESSTMSALVPVKQKMAHAPEVKSIQAMVPPN